jgi:hypothetical protein
VAAREEAGIVLRPQKKTGSEEPRAGHIGFGTAWGDFSAEQVSRCFPLSAMFIVSFPKVWSQF